MSLAELRPVTPPTPDTGSVSLLVDADDCVLVVLHGAVDNGLADEVRELVDDIAGGAVDVAGRPVRVLAEQVTRFDLLGVWLLLELRRAAKPNRVTLVRPTDVVLATVALHELRGLDVES